MNFRATFKKRNVLLVVVHAESREQVQRNVRIAKNEGADGVFLINHAIGPGALLDIYKVVRPLHPQLWMGVNLLGLSALQTAKQLPRSVDGLWCDNAGTSPRISHEAHLMQRYRQEESHWKGIYFGGVEFKGQRQTADPAAAARAAVPFVDVVTTSGSGTGFAPDVSKIRDMKLAIGEHPLAVASGITSRNVREYTQWVDCFLVATGISSSFSELDPKKVGKLVNMLR